MRDGSAVLVLRLPYLAFVSRSELSKQRKRGFDVQESIKTHRRFKLIRMVYAQAKRAKDRLKTNEIGGNEMG